MSQMQLDLALEPVPADDKGARSVLQCGNCGTVCAIPAVEDTRPSLGGGRWCDECLRRRSLDQSRRAS